MRFRTRRSFRWVLFAGILSIPIHAYAQTFQALHAFEAPPREPRGKLLEISVGVFLGTSTFGGAFDKGTIYVLFRRADATWSTFVTHSFSGRDGMWPKAGLIRALDGNYYGSTNVGGVNGAGTVFRLSPSGRLTTLHSFASTSWDRPGPEAPLVQAPDGSFWGTTFQGGATNGPGGTIFRITAAGVHTVMHEFDSSTTGTQPAGLVVGGDGNLYGTTSFHGPLGGGSAYRISPTGVVTVLRDFPNGPGQLIVGPDGLFYGATQSGSVANPNFVFRLTTAGSLTVLHTFDFRKDGVAGPIGALAQAPDGTLFGATWATWDDPTSTENGAVYRLNTDGTLQRLAVFGGPFGVNPASGLTVGSDGFIYGANEYSRRWSPTNSFRGLGAIYRVAPSGPAELLASLGGGPSHPTGKLVPGQDGSLYGTSCAGGVYGLGTVYRLDPANVITVVHSFADVDGYCPTGLGRGPDGAFYGAARGGRNRSADGTIFRITPAGELTTLWDATNVFWWPLGPPAVAADGSLFFAVIGDFSLLRVAPDRTVTRLGWIPGATSSALLSADDGNFYGVSGTSTAAAMGNTLYRLTPDGAITPLHTFGNARGTSYTPMQASDGKLYGAITRTATSTAGLLYSSTLSGEIAVLHQFSYFDGAKPLTELLETSPGRFVGVTTGYAEVGLWGTVFSVGSSGGLSTLHRFSWFDGAHPYGGVTRGSDGALYGATYQGGWLGGGGVIYRIQ